jgi:hypothetical protein
MVTTTTPDTAGLGMADELRFLCSALIGTPAPASIMTQLPTSPGVYASVLIHICAEVTRSPQDRANADDSPTSHVTGRDGWHAE